MINQPEEMLIEFGSGSDLLIKSDKKDPTIIYIEASNETEDRQNDTVLQKALETQVENYLKRGVLSYDHLHKILKKSEYIIGEPLDVKFSKEGKTLVKGKLYKSNEHAQDLMKKLSDGCTRIGASIGGHITKRVKGFNKKLQKAVNFIAGVLWDETALTFKPVNSSTLGGVTYMPYTEFKKSFICEGNNEEILKALQAGAGTDSATFTGGRALIPESLMGSTVQGIPVIGKDLLKNYLMLMIDGKMKSYKDLLKKAEQDGVAPLAPYFAGLFMKNQEKIKTLKTNFKG